jgi:hypothetical protein
MASAPPYARPRKNGLRDRQLRVRERTSSRRLFPQTERPGLPLWRRRAFLRFVEQLSLRH